MAKWRVHPTDVPEADDYRSLSVYISHVMKTKK